jgi:hypothetical protein
MMLDFIGVAQAWSEKSATFRGHALYRPTPTYHAALSDEFTQKAKFAGG